jgi:hypothetical protein
MAVDDHQLKIYLFQDRGVLNLVLCEATEGTYNEKGPLGEALFLFVSI